MCSAFIRHSDDGVSEHYIKPHININIIFPFIKRINNRQPTNGILEKDNDAQERANVTEGRTP